MEYLKRVARVLRESHWAGFGTSFKYAIQLILIVSLIAGATFGIDTLVKAMINF